jgi:hypothetical protein
MVGLLAPKENGIDTFDSLEKNSLHGFYWFRIKNPFLLPLKSYLCPFKTY